MGDVGSLSIGFCVASIAVIGDNRYGIPIVAFVILMGVFVGDATVTLFRRLFRGEKVLQAHRGHFYQRAVRAGCSHDHVVETVIGINVLLAICGSLIVFKVGNMWVWITAAFIILAAAALVVMRIERRRFRTTPIQL